MLALREITKRFGRVLANDRVSFEVDAGTIHAVIGENGAGKSTAMRIAYGFYTADSGTIEVDGAVCRIETPHDAIALGIGMVHQHFMLVPTMTVAENLVLGAEPGSAASLDLRAAAARIRELSDAFTLAVDPDAVVETLSVGEQQRVELLKALYRDARVLILDEPTAVLAPQQVQELFAILARMRSQGKTIVIVTHKLSEVLAISDAVTVMRDGRVVGRVRTADTTAQELARLMVGRDVLLRVEKGPATPGAVALEVRDLSVGDAGAARLAGVSLQVRAGEIVGIAGVDGNGQTELIEALAGLVEPARIAGQVRLGDLDITRHDARSRRLLGITHIPEDRHRRGLVLDFDLAENAILGAHDRPPAVARSGGILLDEQAIQAHAAAIIRECDVRPAQADLPARALSGGNQQKLIIGRECGEQPRLLLVSQPTRGVDIGAIEFIHRRLLAMRDAGCAILLISAELDEVMALSDRVLVLLGGRVVGEVDPAASTVEQVGLLMTRGH